MPINSIRVNLKCCIKIWVFDDCFFGHHLLDIFKGLLMKFSPVELLFANPYQIC